MRTKACICLQAAGTKDRAGQRRLIAVTLQDSEQGSTPRPLVKILPIERRIRRYHSTGDSAIPGPRVAHMMNSKLRTLIDEHRARGARTENAFCSAALLAERFVPRTSVLGANLCVMAISRVLVPYRLCAPHYRPQEQHERCQNSRMAVDRRFNGPSNPYRRW